MNQGSLVVPLMEPLKRLCRTLQPYQQPITDRPYSQQPITNHPYSHSQRFTKKIYIYKYKLKRYTEQMQNFHFPGPFPFSELDLCIHVRSDAALSATF